VNVNGKLYYLTDEAEPVSRVLTCSGSKSNTKSRKRRLTNVGVETIEEESECANDCKEEYEKPRG
jgi:hypothetical protein